MSKVGKWPFDRSKLYESVALFDTFKYLPRLSTKRIPISEKESVAIHLYEMQYLALLAYNNLADEDRNELDLLTIFQISLLHEIEEPIMSDIPYSFKKLVKEDGRKDHLDDLRDLATGEALTHVIPLYSVDFSKFKDTKEAEFVKFLDYVNLYLTCIKYSRKGYCLDNTINECEKLTRNSSWFSKSILVQEIIEHPSRFLDIDFN